jgi:MoxR-like ATPase
VRNSGPVSRETTTSGLSADDVLRLQDAVQAVAVEESLVDYMLAIVEKTRNHESLALGVSPRGAQALYRATQALALLAGREFAIPDDVKRLAVPIFAHRVVVNTRTALAPRRADVGERIIEEILSQVEVPL